MDTSKQLMKKYIKARTKEMNKGLTEDQICKIGARVLERIEFPRYVGYLDSFIEDEFGVY